MIIIGQHPAPSVQGVMANPGAMVTVFGTTIIVSRRSRAFWIVGMSVARRMDLVTGVAQINCVAGRVRDGSRTAVLHLPVVFITFVSRRSRNVGQVCA